MATERISRAGVVGVISDTHGMLRPQALAALEGVEFILHLGDVGDEAVLTALRKIAPVTAVRGNVDVSGACGRLPMSAVVEWHGFTMYLLHRRQDLDLKPGAAGFAAVLYGHTHKALIEQHDAVLYFNPGSAGPRRFDLPATVGLLRDVNGNLQAEIVDLDTGQEV